MLCNNNVISDRSRPGIFSGLTFVVRLAGPQFRGFPKDKDSFTNQLRKHVLKRICANDGIIVGVEDSFITGATYLIATHEKQRAVLEARQAQDKGACVRIYGPQWVLACVDNQQLITEEPEHWGLLAGPHDPGIPGFRDFTNHIRVSGVPADRRDFRMLLLYWVECMGGRSANETAAMDTSHVLTWNSGTLTPAQLEIEQRYPHVRHVHYTWIMLCRSSWEMVDDAPFRMVPPKAITIRHVSEQLLAYHQRHNDNCYHSQVHGHQKEAPQQEQELEEAQPQVGQVYCKLSGKDADNLSWRQGQQAEAPAACHQGAFLPSCRAGQPKPAPELRHSPCVKQEPTGNCDPVGPQACKMESGSDAHLQEVLSCVQSKGSWGLQQTKQLSIAGSNPRDEHPCRVAQSVGDAGAWIEFGHGSGRGASCSRPEDALQTVWTGTRYREIERPEQGPQGQEQQQQPQQQQQQQGQELLCGDVGMSEAGHFRCLLTSNRCKVTASRCLEEPLRSPLKPLDPMQQPWLFPIGLSAPSARCDLRTTSAAQQENGDGCLVNTPTQDCGHECSKPAVGSSTPTAGATASPSAHATILCPPPGPCLGHDTRSTNSGNAGCRMDATTLRDHVECALNCHPSAGTSVRSTDRGANRFHVRTSNAASVGVSPIDGSAPTPSILEPQLCQVDDDTHVVTGIAELSHGVGKPAGSQGPAFKHGAPAPSLPGAPGCASQHAGAVEAPSWQKQTSDAVDSGLAVQAACADNQKHCGKSPGDFGRGRGESSERDKSADGVPSCSPRVEKRRMPTNAATTTTRDTLRSQRCEVDLLQDVGVPSRRGRGRGRVKAAQISGPAPLKARPDAAAVTAALAEKAALAMVGMVGHLSSSGHTDRKHTAGPSALPMDGKEVEKAWLQARQGRRRRLCDVETPADPAAADVSSMEPGGGAAGAAAAAAAADDDNRCGKGIGNAAQTPEHYADHPGVPDGHQCKETGLPLDRGDVREHGADGTEQAASPPPGPRNRQGCADSGMKAAGGSCDGAWRNDDLEDGAGDAMKVDPVQQYRTADPDHASGPAGTRARVVTADLAWARPRCCKRPAGSQPDDNDAKAAQDELEPKYNPVGDGFGGSMAGKPHDAPTMTAAGRSGAAVNGDEMRRTAKRRCPGPTEAIVPVDAPRTTVPAAVAPLAADVQGSVEAGEFVNSAVAVKCCSGSSGDAALRDAIEEREGRNARPRTVAAEAADPGLSTAAIASQKTGCDSGGGADARDAKKSGESHRTQRRLGKVEEDHQEPPQQQLSGKAKGRKAARTANRALASKPSSPMEKRPGEDSITADSAPPGLVHKSKVQGSRQGNSIDDMEVPGLATTQPVASQRLQVRGGGGGGIDDSCTGPHAKVRKLIFALSGFTAEERARYGSTLKALRLAYVPVNNDWDPKINALLAPSLKRSDKTVCAMAAGAWLLRADYLAACQGQDPGATQREIGATQGAGAGGVAPEDFELHECEDGPAVISYGAPAHWRQRLAARGPSGRAFSGLRVLVPPGLPPPLDSGTLARMLGAGGGVAVVKAAPSAAKGCHVGVVPPGFKQEDKLVASLQAAGAVVVTPAYVVDWVAHPHALLVQHYRHGTSPGEALGPLERDRGVV